MTVTDRFLRNQTLMMSSFLGYAACQELVSQNSWLRDVMIGLVRGLERSNKRSANNADLMQTPKNHERT